MTTRISFSLLIIASLGLVNCGGGGTPNKTLLADPIVVPADGSKQDFGVEVSTTPLLEDPIVFAPFTSQAKYRVTLENFWGVEDFPQGFPDDAHLSLIGGATHNAAVSFWGLGEVASAGIEDMAEAGLIDRLLFDEVAPTILNGTANSMIEIREYTDAQIDGVPGVQVFEVEMDINWPLVSMVTMLGPSPDWFVGVAAFH